ncbi:turripeptide Ici9.2-like isoform X2 [Hermetia illucens]|uniref:turripeptide Ici9.2-like isoform X2 n=1 Tax=Hermetia illucens TaxID=343691 RepID=UPI0018CC4D0A|nr:turripeptide Ici9.2-like isoform X2 [Hermetia illucens]
MIISLSNSFELSTPACLSDALPLKMNILALILFSLIVGAFSAKKAPCTDLCTLEDWPVCGMEGARKQTFPNYCVLQMENCLKGTNFRKIKDGEC